MRDIPLEVMLSWPPGNYVNPVTRGNTIVIVNAILFPLVTFVVILRLYVRTHVLRWFGIDDLFIIIALLGAAGHTACVVLANLEYGWNRHVWDIPLTTIPKALQVGWALKLCYAVAACFTRQSLLLFYYRLVRDCSMKSFRQTIHVVSVFSVIVMFLIFIGSLLQCRPIRAFWTWPQMPGSYCLNDGYITVGIGITNIVADLLVTIVPIPLIARLNLPPRRRIGAMMLVGTGFIVCTAGCVRTYWTWQSLVKSYDQTWESYGMFYSAAIEIDLGVICACVPSLRLLLVKGARSTVSLLSTQVSRVSPFSSKYIKDSQVTGADSFGTVASPTGGAVVELVAKGPGWSAIGPNSTPATASASMARKGFVGTWTSSLISNSESQMPCSRYLWDEPWSGNNAPRTTLDHNIGEVDTTVDHSKDGMLAASSTQKVSERPMVPHRANTVQLSTSTSMAGMTSRNRTVGGLDTVIAEQKGVGMLPDAVSLRSSIQRPQSLDDDDDMDLPIQGTPIDELHPRDILTLEKHIGNRLSWLRFDLDSTTESVRPQASDVTPGRKRLSWLDDRSYEDLYEERGQGLRDEGVSRTGDREKSMRPLSMERRREELGWDLESNKYEVRENW